MDVSGEQMNDLVDMLYDRSLRYFSTISNPDSRPLRCNAILRLEARHSAEEYMNVILDLMNILPKDNTHSVKTWLAIIMGEEAERILK